MGIIYALFKMGLLYFIIVISYRLMGKKKIGELSITDFIVFLLLSNIITLSIPASDQSFMYMTILIAFLIALQVTMTYLSYRIPTFKYMFNSKPSFIINNGKLNFKEMFKRHYNLDDLLLQLREKSITNIEDVEYATLENNGKLSIFGYNKNNSDIPVPIILDGKIQHVTLKLLHKDNAWLYRIIEKESVTLNNIFYAFYKQGKLYIIKNDQ